MTVVVAAFLVFAAVLWWPSGTSSGSAVAAWDHPVREPRPDGVPDGPPHGGPGPFVARARHLVRPARSPTPVSGPTDALAVLDALQPALRAGLAPVTALRCLEAVRPGGRLTLVDDLVAAAERGAPLAPVLAAAARNESTEGTVSALQLAGAAWALSERLGAPLADAVGAAADELRQEALWQRRVAVALAGPRATVRVLTLLPIAGPLLALLLGLSPGQVWGNSLALVSLVAGVVTMLVGRWWCRRMVAGLAAPTPAEGAAR